MPNNRPFTFALQRYFLIERLTIGSLAFAHAGVEFALSTPWVAGSDIAPIAPIQILDVPDTEPVDNGWKSWRASVNLLTMSTALLAALLR